MKAIDKYLQMMVDQDASDLFFSTGSPPYMKVDGATRVTDAPRLEPGAVKELAYSIMSEEQRTQFEAKLESNFATALEGIGRFRVNVYFQRGQVAMVLRRINTMVRDFASLGLPPEMGELAMLKQGLVLVVGAAGSGKSTTLAAMVDYRAANADDHILTIEDPIEFLYTHRRSLVDQREVGIDTLSFGDALRNAMREAPDVIMIGEIRDVETAHHAIAYAEAGHLCLSTLHANNANQAIDRIINFFPASAHKQLLMDLSLNLEAVISQRLVNGIDGKRVLALELLRKSGFIGEMIRQGRLNEIKREMERGNQEGVITFDQSLFGLYESGVISKEEALQHVDSHADLAVRIRLSHHLSAIEAPFATVVGMTPAGEIPASDPKPPFQAVGYDSK